MAGIIADTLLTDQLSRARSASRNLARLDRDGALLSIAEALEANGADILSANRRDVESERLKGTSGALIDRLSLSEARIGQMAAAVQELAALPDPLDRVIEGWTSADGLRIRKVSVPFGVIGMIYESRPNVTVDAATLALKAGSASVLRGSSNALASNRVLVRIMREALERVSLPTDAIQLVDSEDRRLVTALLEARGQVDLVIPRGGASLINHVVETAKVPVIETGLGNCHVYVDAEADLAQARDIIMNAKVQRPGVCNAAETLLVHERVAEAFVPEALAALREAGVELVGCERTRVLDTSVGPAAEEDWLSEYHDYKLAVRVVSSLSEAIDHINLYGSQHSEAIVTKDLGRARAFQDQVDAAAVYVNASTRFTDGFMFGFGAEIGISTQKLHARGPMGLAEITTHKYLIEGEGQVRS